MKRSSVVASMMARVVLFISFIGSTITFILWLMGNREASGLACLGFLAVAAVALLIGGIFVARARAAE
jgi:uncharacterized membrane protein